MSLGMEADRSLGDFVLDGDPVHPPQKVAVPLPNFRPISIVANGWMYQHTTLYGGRPQPRELCVRWGPRPSPKGDGAPIFGPCLLRPNGSMNQDATHCARWGPSSPPQKGGGQSPPFSAHLYCGQTAGCIKMTLGMAVGLSPGDFVLDGDPAPLPLKGHSPHFRPMSVVAKRLGGLINVTWYGRRPRSRQLCSMGTQLPSEKGHTHLHQIFSPCLWPQGWMDQDATWYGAWRKTSDHATLC